MENEFPPNSHSRAEETKPARKSEAPARGKDVSRVTRNKVIRRKKPLRKRFAETFTREDNQGIFEYVVLEVLAPGLRDAVAEAGTSAIERVFYGESAGRSPRRRGGSGGYTSYSGMSAGRRDPRGRDRDRDERPKSRRPGRGPSSHEEIIVETRVEANEILDSLFELISRYEVATMRDLLSLAGEPHTNTDEDWGWTDLRGARAHKIREGYLIDVPRPEPLD